MRIARGVALSVAASFFLNACFSAFDAPRSHPASVRTAQAGADEYRVLSGDTLYSIAFRKQLDYHEVADWNGIPGPAYTIYPGRILRLTPPGGQRVTAPPPEVASETSAPREPSPPAPNPLPPDSAPPPRLPPPAIAAAVAHIGHGHWEWPTQGRVARGFGVEGSKGLDIAGDAGQIVIAASAGKVVYSGSALKGYGELVIIKHDEQFLSAYGYNRRRLVNEGDLVAAGQPIAELGFGPEQKPELHFEIRDKGRPVDPLALLPARS